MTDSLEVLNGSGHITIKWDPSKPGEVEKARTEVEDLRKLGYSFFAVVGGPGGTDEISAGNGQLIVERIENPILPPEKKPAPKKGKKDPPAKGRRNVAVRPMAGG